MAKQGGNGGARAEKAGKEPNQKLKSENNWEVRRKREMRIGSREDKGGLSEEDSERRF